jgi:5-oxoprolinase (ATP-hydrolysing)
VTSVRTLLAEGAKRLAGRLRSHRMGDPGHTGVSIVSAGGIVLATTAPATLANAAAVARACRTRLGDLAPGDAALTNDPFSGSPHLQDHWVAVPLGSGAAPLLLCHAHLADVGGQCEGNLWPWAAEIWQEGTRTTPVRLRSGGRLRRDLIEVAGLNSRHPEAMEHDLLELLAVAEELARGIAPLLDGDEGPRPAGAPLAAALPAGEAGASAALHNCAGEDLVVEARVTTTNGRVVVDLAGSSAQPARGFLGSPLPSTVSAVAGAVAAAARRPVDAALLAELDVRAPAGSVVACEEPAAVGWSPYGTRAAIETAVATALARLTGEEARLPAAAARPVTPVEPCGRAGCPL